MRTLTVNLISYASKPAQKLDTVVGTMDEVVAHLHRYCPSVGKAVLKEKVKDTLAQDSLCIHLGFNRLAIELVEISGLVRREKVQEANYACEII